MASAEQDDQQGVALSARQACRALSAARSPIRVAREVRELTFRGSRAELQRATALRLQAAVVLLFLAVRCFHLGQAGVDLALAGHAYTVAWLALLVGVACAVESLLVAALALAARRLTWTAILADAAFGVAGLALMAVATSSGPGRTGSLNWMLPYTVATATGLGVLAGGDLVDNRPAAQPAGEPDSFASASEPGSFASARQPDSFVSASEVSRRLAHGRVWGLVLAVALAGTYVASAYLPHRLAYDHPGQIWGNTAYYLVFFAAGAATLEVTRRLVTALSTRNAEVAKEAAQVAREAQWRAISVDVFGPVSDLLDRVAQLADGAVPAAVREEADRLIPMIDAVNPGGESVSLGAPPTGAAGGGMMAG
jgi:hypothetical protein